jgi:hypothetical protein
MVNLSLKRLLQIVVCFVLVCVIIVTALVLNNSSSTSKLFINTNAVVQNINYEKSFTGDSTDLKELTTINHAGEGYVKKAETMYLELYLKIDSYIASAGSDSLSKQRYNVAVFDKRTNHLWKSIIPDSNIDYVNLSESIISAMQSLFTFSYVDYDRDKSAQQESNPMLENTQVKEEKIANGFRLNYFISNLMINISIDFKVSGDNFDVVIPQDKIIDNAQNSDSIIKSRLLVQNKVEVFGTKVDELSRMGLAGFSENRGKAIQLQIDSLHYNLMNLSDLGQSGSSSSDLLAKISDSVSYLKNYLSKDKKYDTILKQIITLSEYFQKNAESMNASRICGLVNVDLMPYFGAQNSKANGYIFFPDKCGAISYFNIYHPEMVGFYNEDIYSNHTIDLALFKGLKSADQVDYSTITGSLSTAMMPVFGIKNDDSAFVSIIAQGDMDASISYYPATKAIDINRTGATFIMRNTTKTITGTQNVVKIIDSKLISQPRRLRYILLDKDNADYSGMAVKYRDFLEQFNLIKTSNYFKTDQMPLSLEFFMGLKTVVNGNSSQYQKLTSYSDVEKILTDLKSKGISSINSTLRGWSNTGFYDNYPDYEMTIPGDLGGDTAIKQLMNYANKNNFPVGLETQSVFGNKSDMIYSEVDTATVKNYGYFPVELYGDYIFNPTAIFNKYKNSILDKIKSYDAKAITLTREGNVLYNDYNKNAAATRSNTAAIMDKIGQLAKDKLGYVNYYTPNMYMSTVADWMLNVPEDSSKYLFADEEVPFYQIVVHGSIPYTGKAFNLMHDKTAQYLQYIEYGYIPFYELTNDEPVIKGNNNVDFLFSTVASSWMDRIVSQYKEFNNTVGTLWKTKIAKDEKIDDSLACVTYETGDKVLVNYSKQDKNYKGTIIPAESAKLIRS